MARVKKQGPSLAQGEMASEPPVHGLASAREFVTPAHPCDAFGVFCGILPGKRWRFPFKLSRNAAVVSKRTRTTGAGAGTGAALPVAVLLPGDLRSMA
jgi:hypothetical protein